MILLQFGPLTISLIYLSHAWKYRTWNALKWTGAGFLFLVCAMAPLEYSLLRGRHSVAYSDTIFVLVFFICPIFITLYVLSLLCKGKRHSYAWSIGLSLACVGAALLSGESVFAELEYMLILIFVLYAFFLAAFITIPIQLRDRRTEAESNEGAPDAKDKNESGKQ